MSKPLSVLIVDDSALVRQALKQVLERDPDIHVMDVAANPYIAVDKLKHQVPDVITLDIEMPRMDGLTFLKTLMQQHPIPVVICSSLAEERAESTLRALEYGAVDIIHKPRVDTRKFFEESSVLICDAVKAAARAKPRKRPSITLTTQPKLTADAVVPRGAGAHAMVKTTEKVVAIGASTGGTEALRVLLEAMPEDAPGLVIVQHMPESFTAAFAKRLDSLCRISVKEAAPNDTVLPGHALIAPGNRHMFLKRSGARYYVDLKDGPLVCRHRPSVDVLFRTAARYAGKNAVGVMLTGMGDDGAKGMLEMKQAGAFNIAQDEQSCVVYGMPKEAVKLGAVDHILSLEAIPAAILNASR